MPYEVLNARVKQKINTEEQWIAEEDSFGVIFEGEQAFVYNEVGQAVNFKIGDGTKKFSELPYFIAYYSGVTNQKVLSWINTTANITVPDVFKNNSLLTDLIFYNDSGFEITLKVGTTNGGGELFEVTVPVGASSIECKYPFSANTTIYLTGITGKECSVFMLFFQLDESPAIPPTSSGGGASFAYGTVYSFTPMYDGHTNYAWDFTTNRGKSGTPFENCIILPDMDGAYLRGYKVGDTLGATVGNLTGNIELTLDNMPNHNHLMFNTDIQTSGGNDLDSASAYVRFQRNANIKRDYILAESGTPASIGSTSYAGNGQPFSIVPKSIIILYFTGPATT